MENDYLKEKIKAQIALDNFIDYKEKNRKFELKKMIFVASAFLILFTGVVFAKDIKKYIKGKFGMGNGVQTAFENGYVGNTKSDFINSEVIIDDEKVNIGVKINDFIITDTSINFEMEIRSDNEKFDFYNLKNITFEDLFILDNENKLIVSPSFLDEDRKLFENFCKEHNLNYTYREFNENYLYSNFNSEIIEINDEENTIKFNYNIELNGIVNSKNLNLYFNKITFILENKEKICLSGKWNINIDVPEIMYNRKDIYYNVIKQENHQFDIYMAKATDIGFEVGIEISDINLPILYQELINTQTGTAYIFNTREELLSIDTNPEFENKYIQYQSQKRPVRLDGYSGVSWLNYTEGCYIIDEGGNKYFSSSNNTKKQNANFIYSSNDHSNENNFLHKFDFYDEFDMTKYNATNTITLVIDFYGEPVKFMLKEEK